MSKTYIHYGDNFFDKDLFVSPTNQPNRNKPKGGLWASDINAKYDWKDWCEDSDYDYCDLKSHFKFKLTDNANIFTINSVEDIDKMPRQRFDHELFLIKPIDFEAMVKNGIDAIEYNLSNDNGLCYALYSWDCDCILILNPDIIVPVSNY